MRIANAIGVDGSHQNMMSCTYQLRASCSRRQIESSTNICNGHPGADAYFSDFVIFHLEKNSQTQSRGRRGAQSDLHIHIDHAEDDGDVESRPLLRFRPHAPAEYMRILHLQKFEHHVHMRD